MGKEREDGGGDWERRRLERAGSGATGKYGGAAQAKRPCQRPHVWLFPFLHIKGKLVLGKLNGPIPPSPSRLATPLHAFRKSSRAAQR